MCGKIQLQNLWQRIRHYYLPEMELCIFIIIFQNSPGLFYKTPQYCSVHGTRCVAQWMRSLSHCHKVVSSSRTIDYTLCSLRRKWVPRRKWVLWVMVEESLSRSWLTPILPSPQAAALVNMIRR